MKKNLLVSFSGGETSAFMSQWIWNHWKDEYNLVFVFANTGLERFETLVFVNNCSNYFGFPVHYIEAKIHPEKGVGTTFEEIGNHLELKNAQDRQTPFEQMVKKYGLPNQNFPHCTRELKTVPIRKFGQEYFGTRDFHQAIGIRIDEIDRMSTSRVKNKLIYPLIESIPTNHSQIDAFWSEQKFRLDLKGYEGNCAMCWKKDMRKLALIAKEQPYYSLAFYKLEAHYGFHYPNKVVLDENGMDKPIRMFRGHTTIIDIEKMEVTKEEVLAIGKQRTESCDAYAECGIDN